MLRMGAGAGLALPGLECLLMCRIRREQRRMLGTWLDLSERRTCAVMRSAA